MLSRIPSILFEITDFFTTLSVGQELSCLMLFLAAAIFFLIVVKAGFAVLTFLAKKTKTDFDDALIASTKMLFYYAAVFTAFYLSLDFSYPGTEIAGIKLFDIYIIGILMIISVGINSIIDVVLVWYGKSISPDKRKIKIEEVYPFVRNVVKVLVYVAFAIIILGRLGIEIAPLVAGLGIAGLAVALALQETLSNFFAGIHILADKPFREGDFIGIEGGLIGTVSSIGWRSTKIVEPRMTTIIIPNAKLAQSTIINYATPSPQMGVLDEVGVDYNNDIDKVAKLIFDVLKKVQKNNPRMVKDAEPWVRFDKFGDWALIFKYGYMVTSWMDQWDVRREVNRELFYAFKKHKIGIPFPVHTVYMKKAS